MSEIIFNAANLDVPNWLLRPENQEWRVKI